MLYAIPLVDEEILDPKEFKIFWIPYVELRMKLGKKERAYCFDYIIPKILDDPLLYVALMRNPKDFNMTQMPPKAGKIIKVDDINGKALFDIIFKIRDASIKYSELAKQTAKKLLRKSVIQLLIPVQTRDSKKLSLYEEFQQVLVILEAAGFMEDNIEYLGERFFYWPIAIHTKENVVFELALKRTPSNSYTQIHKKFNLIKILEEL